MRFLLFQAFLLLLYFQNVVHGGSGRHKRQFGMANRDEENSPFNFANSFDGQITFEKQKAALMQELELKLAELRANNKQELANAVMELKHQLAGLGKTLLLGQTQQGLLLSAAAAAGRRKPEANAVEAVATTTGGNNGGEHIAHRSLFTKLEALSRNFTQLTSNYRSALQNDKNSKQQKQSQSKQVNKNQPVESKKWKSDYELDNGFYDLDNFQLGVKTAKSTKKRKKQGKQFKSKKPIKDFEEAERVAYPFAAEQPSFYDSQPRQLPAVERSVAEGQGGSGGGGDQDQQITNKYLYYFAAGALALFGYCCFAMNSADDVNSQNQELFLKKQREMARREKRKMRKSRKRRKRSRDSEDDDDQERRPFSKYKRVKEQRRRRQRRRLRYSKRSTSLDRSVSAELGGLKSVRIGSLKQQPPTSTIPPVPKMQPTVATGFTLHQMDGSSSAFAPAADQTAEPVIVFEADQVQQFCGAHSDMATRLEAMLSESRLISQMIEARKQSGLSSAEDQPPQQPQQENAGKQQSTSAPPGAAAAATERPTTSNSAPNGAGSQHDTADTTPPPPVSPVTSVISRSSSVVKSAQQDQVLFQAKSAAASSSKSPKCQKSK